ncbi:MAG: hypothetical protein GC138_03345 [Gammaproteobacteria bacterium]|nr:hypothetical protein [Gammaproteobacteria bacterium]
MQRSLFSLLLLIPVIVHADDQPSLTIKWEKNILTIAGDHLPGPITINYLEAYCRPGSTDRDWHETVIGHKTQLVEASEDKKTLKLKCTLKDGVTVEHVITAGKEDVDFRLTAHNPTDQESAAHWAQPCIRVDQFVGVPSKGSSEEYLPKSFIYVDGKLTRLPTQPWAKKARYIPGQVYAPKGVPREDVNPRPLSDIVPSNGLIGCFSKDGRQLLAMAWDQTQELFQGVIVCLHNDPRLGGLKPAETRQLRGRIYLLPNDPAALLARYRKDFPASSDRGQR